MNRDAEEHGMGGNKDFFQFEKSGSYVLRVLTKPLALATHFFGKGQPSSVCYGYEKGCPFHGTGAPKDDKGKEKAPSVKYMAYVIDRSDGQIKIGELPWSVVSRIADFEEDTEIGFSEYPMSRDIKVKVDKENKDPKSMYKTDSSVKEIPVEGDTLIDLNKKKEHTTIEQFIQKRKEKQLEKHKNDGTWDKEMQRRKELGERLDAVKPKPNLEAGEADVDEIPF